MTDLGDRMKTYEMAEAGRKLMPLLPIIVRLDGKSFHTFTHGLTKPFCRPLMDLMDDVTSYLVGITSARIGYTQSDEISLVIKSDDVKSQVMFDGRISKLVSILAAQASVKFNDLISTKYIDTELGKKLLHGAVFDCRVWNVPSQTEAANTLLWREKDATKNSISMVAHHHFSHKSLQGMSGNQKQYRLLTEKGVNWNDFSNREKRGAFFRRIEDECPPEPALVRQLEEKGLPVPDTVRRGKVVCIDMPPFGKVLNREDVIFNKAAPIVSDVSEQGDIHAK